MSWAADAWEGMGSGAGATVFANRFSVQISEPVTTITRRAKVSAQPAEKQAPQARQQAKDSKRASVCTTPERCAVTTPPDCITVMQHTTSTTLTTQLATATIKGKS